MPDSGKHGRKKEQGQTENQMDRWYHRNDEHEIKGNGGQKSLACYGPWGHEESDMFK